MGILLVSVIIFASACGPSQTEISPISLDERGLELTPIPDSDKEHPKLDSFLNQLVEANERGESKDFALRSNVELIDGKVRVQVEAATGMLDEAVEATTNEGYVELVIRKYNHIQAVIPITGLYTLAEKESIRIITIPIPPTPTDNKPFIIEIPDLNKK